MTAPATPIVLFDDDGAWPRWPRPRLAAMGYTRRAGARRRPRRPGGAAGRPWSRASTCPARSSASRCSTTPRRPKSRPRARRAHRAGSDMVIVDARTPEEYARGCLPGAWSVPGGELVLRIGELVRRPDRPIVVHCGGRTRSYVGAESLRRMHLPNPVVAVENGTMGWELAGLELERGASRWAPPASAEEPRARRSRSRGAWPARTASASSPRRGPERAVGAARPRERLRARRADSRGVRRRPHCRRPVGARRAGRAGHGRVHRRPRGSVVLVVRRARRARCMTASLAHAHGLAGVSVLDGRSCGVGARRRRGRGGPSGRRRRSARRGARARSSPWHPGRSATPWS